MDYKIGDRVVYHSGSRRVVLVDEKEDDIKNGRSGFGGTVEGGPDDGMSVWGYDYQIISVIPS